MYNKFVLIMTERHHLYHIYLVFAPMFSFALMAAYNITTIL